MKNSEVYKWMLKQADAELSDYLDSSDCFNCTKLAEDAHEHFVKDSDEIPESFFEESLSVCDKLVKEGLVNE